MDITAKSPEASAPIGREQVKEAQMTLEKYKRGKVNLEKRIKDNEQFYKLRHWELVDSSKNPGDLRPASAWLFNCIANKHADAMDNYPEPNVLPREQGDESDADLLTAILPVVLKQNRFEQTYSDMWWYKLKAGTGVLGVFWSTSKNNGLGDIDIQKIDLLNLFWEPGITDIQKSRNLFHVGLMDKDLLGQRYPEMADAISAPTIDIAEYIYDDEVDTTSKVIVVDWYYKISVGGRDVLHYCKFCNGEVLYASENDPDYAERGFYDHGKYPFIFDALFPVEGTPTGYGYIDICKEPQTYIDKMDQVILKSSIMGARPRFFVRDDGKINKKEFSDWTKDLVHFTGSGDPNDSIIPIKITPLSEMHITARAQKIDELKETSGNRDFSQGGTSSGVTAASAIAALQEAGSKLSRDMISRSYHAFAEVNYFCIDLMRQFYQEDRWIRVIGKRGEIEFKQFSGASLAQKPQGGDFGLDLGYRVPIFDIEVGAQRASPFSTVAQNERAKELYQLGFFAPQLADQSLAALEMMQFEGIEQVRERIAQNGTLYQQVMQMQQQMMQMAAIIDAMQGTTIAQGMAAEFSQQGDETPISSGATGEMDTNALGEAYNTARRGTAGAARQRAASAAAPR